MGRLASELDSIKRELASIASELDGLAGETRSSFEGIGNDRCARSLDNVSSNCRTVKSRLDKVDLSYIDALEEKHPGGKR